MKFSFSSSSFFPESWCMPSVYPERWWHQSEGAWCSAGWDAWFEVSWCFIFFRIKALWKHFPPGKWDIVDGLLSVFGWPFSEKVYRLVMAMTKCTRVSSESLQCLDSVNHMENKSLWLWPGLFQAIHGASSHLEPSSSKWLSWEAEKQP